MRRNTGQEGENTRKNEMGEEEETAVKETWQKQRLEASEEK